MPIVARAVIMFLCITLATSFAGCGGGDTESEPIHPSIELRANQTVRLWLATDAYGQIVGFNQPLRPDSDIEIVWHSGMVSSELPYAPRGLIQQESSGRFYADIALAYAKDRGIFTFVRKGYVPWIVYGQPMAHLVPNQWALPAGVQPVDVYGGRIWLDISFH
ncbi:MAG: hypothetical protein ACEQSB_02925 [Undibacterium sp.]